MMNQPELMIFRFLGAHGDTFDNVVSSSETDFIAHEIRKFQSLLSFLFGGVALLVTVFLAIMFGTLSGLERFWIPGVVLLLAGLRLWKSYQRLTYVHAEGLVRWEWRDFLFRHSTIDHAPTCTVWVVDASVGVIPFVRFSFPGWVYVVVQGRSRSMAVLGTVDVDAATVYAEELSERMGAPMKVTSAVWYRNFAILPLLCGFAPYFRRARLLQEIPD